jgi:hypothetical protein
VSPELALEVGIQIDAALNDVAAKFEEMGDEGPDDVVDDGSDLL